MKLLTIIRKIWIGMGLIVFVFLWCPHMKVSSAQDHAQAAAAGNAAEKTSDQGPAEVVTLDDDGVQPPVTAETSESDVAEEMKSEQETPDVSAAVEPGNITVNFKGADIRTVLAYISEVAKVDIVPSPDVKGTIDLKLTNKPWKVALDIILRNYGFAYEREGDIIRVVTVDKLKQEELSTQAFNLDYAGAKDIVAAVKDMLTDRGKVKYDDRTNMVLVTDIPTNIYKIGQIIDRLDKITDHVLIETLVIETTLSDNERLGIDWNATFEVAGAKRPTTFPFEYFKTPFSYHNEDANEFFPRVQTAAPSTTTVGAGGATVTDLSAEFPSAAGGVAAFPFVGADQFTFGTLDFSQFKAVLDAIKQRSNLELVANPRISTLNNQKASIHVGITVFMPKFERNSTTGKMEITGYEMSKTKTEDGKQETEGLKTGIYLEVTPHVNSKKEIVVDLAPTISDQPQFQRLDAEGNIVAPVISERMAKTQARIKDGETIFIGGLIREDNIEKKNKLPFLGDMLGEVPYIGLLFSHKSIQREKKELIFFVTVNMMDKKIANIPEAKDVYIPLYTASQGEAPKTYKKRLKKAE